MSVVSSEGFVLSKKIFLIFLTIEKICLAVFFLVNIFLFPLISNLTYFYSFLLIPFLIYVWMLLFSICFNTCHNLILVLWRSRITPRTCELVIWFRVYWLLFHFVFLNHFSSSWNSSLIFVPLYYMWLIWFLFYF